MMYRVTMEVLEDGIVTASHCDTDEELANAAWDCLAVFAKYTADDAEGLLHDMNEIRLNPSYEIK
jgi:hypothetical protein